MPITSLSAGIYKTACNTLSQSKPSHPMSLGEELYKSIQAEAIRAQNSAVDNDIYTKITNPLKISILEVSKQIRGIKNMFKQNPKAAIKEFKDYLHKLIDQTGIEISNEHVVNRAKPEELLMYNVAPRGRVQEFSTPIKAKKGVCTSVFFLDRNENILAQGLISPNNKVENMYNALSTDGSSIAFELYTRGGTDYGSLMLYNKNHKLNCGLTLEGENITYRKAR